MAGVVVDISGCPELEMSVDDSSAKMDELGAEVFVAKVDEVINGVAREVVEDASGTSLLIEEAGVIESAESVVVEISPFTALELVVESVVVAAGTQAYDQTPIKPPMPDLVHPFGHCVLPVTVCPQVAIITVLEGCRLECDIVRFSNEASA